VRPIFFVGCTRDFFKKRERKKELRGLGQAVILDYAYVVICSDTEAASKSISVFYPIPSQLPERMVYKGPI
jgi:hypothetical protein